MTFVSELEPTSVWGHFDDILAIPRASKDEGRMRDHVQRLAESRGYETRSDAAGNLVVVVPASAGRESAPAVVLQSHLDMVQEKNSDVDFDFASDGIRPQRDGDYLTADGTTLGSDNGIGVAAMLALMTGDGVEHGPLELLFTIDEETGLTGAGNLGDGMLTGRRLLNLDTEEEGALYVGCAGGLGSRLVLPLDRSAVPGGSVALALQVGGFKGGHSGVDIHLQRGNAIKALARALHAGYHAVPFRLASLTGGSAHNAIPREAFATVVVEAGRKDELAAAVEAEFATVQRELAGPDPDARLTVTAADAPAEAWDEATTAGAVHLLDALPHGVLTMSHDIPDLVETSTTLATVVETDAGLDVLLSTRSSVDSAMVGTARRIRAIAELAGAGAEEEGGYPGWKPDMASELLAVTQRVHHEELGDEPEVKAVHAGLECGIIGEKYPGMDMISFGPQIEFPHSPDERVQIPSVEKFWRLLTATLRELS